jgi:hypothetical protein
MRYVLDAPENCRFVRCVDPPPLHPQQKYIYYLKNRIFNLEREMSSGDKDKDEDDNKNGAGSQKVSCINLYCNCPYNRNKRPPPPPPAMGGYYGEGNLLCGNGTRRVICLIHMLHLCVCCFV